MGSSRRCGAVACVALFMVACSGGGSGGGGGGGGGGADTLLSIALSPLSISLVPGATQQLVVEGRYGSGSVQALPAAGETFQSSDASVATVSAAGVLTVSATALPGSTATISATDTASGETTAAAGEAVLTVLVPGPPTANSATAATQTAQNNALCTLIQPFYWEIGNQASMLANGSEGVDTNGDPVTATNMFSIASASKWVYGTYIVQLRGGASQLTAADIPFLNFTSGYTNMGSDTTGSQCPSTNSPDTVNVCLAELNSANNLPYSTQFAANIGRFDYDSGHLENHASLYGQLGDVRDVNLGSTVAALLGPGITLTYSEPLMAGGIYTDADNYAAMLRNIMSGALYMRDALGTNAVCTLPSADCNAVYSPIPEAWHYSMTHWVEDDPSTHGDGAFSSAGAFGFYPWIEASKLYYGVISRQQSASGGGLPMRNGYASAKCGRLIRRAWDTGIEQTGALPQ
jgi:hypothetical protein